MTKRNIGWDWYSNGKRAFFKLTSEVKGSDGKTFDPLNYQWARDSKSVYRFDRPLRGADPKTFQVLNDVFAKDANRVYFLSGFIKEADPETFTVFSEHPADAGMSYAKDKTNVYFQVLTIGKPRIVRDANPETFRSLGGGYGLDAEAVYYGGYQIKGARPDQFRMLCSNIYSCDNTSVFCNGSRISGVSPGTFQVLPDGRYARDKDGYFNLDRTISKQDYVDELRKQFVFVGTVVGTSVVDRDKKEVPECFDPGRHSGYGVSLKIRCERIVHRPDIKVDNTPALDEEFVFYQYLGGSATYTEWIGKQWIWCFHPLKYRDDDTLAPTLEWRYYCPPEKLGEVMSLFSELLP